MTRRPRWLIPAAVAFLGFVVISAGIAYATVSGGGLPYQDPSPELYASWKYHNDIASAVMSAGAIIAALGTLMLIGVLILRGLSPRRS